MYFVRSVKIIIYYMFYIYFLNSIPSYSLRANIVFSCTNNATACYYILQLYEILSVYYNTTEMEPETPMILHEAICA